MPSGLHPPHHSEQNAAARPHVLDDLAWAALTGPHRHLAELLGGAARYQPGMSPFVALADAEDPRAWKDLAQLVEPGVTIAVIGTAAVPGDWEIVNSIHGVQLVDETLRAASEPEAVRLGPADVPEMLDLVARTRPGPFQSRTIELGAYYGIRRGGRLAAMAGERLRVPGWTEISAVCTDPDHRGHGLATRLLRHTAAGIRDRGDTPFLQAAETNTGAIGLYESIGFTVRRRILFTFARIPETAQPTG
ncbi:GNAT family N-acetyltransferase [Streptomyces sp. H39-S7]|uniref:GNAT family N-acetyltransferase n=1 Tax=Streptomyces sp. H39-S7 TaxID=3004357 RepID=UPI0022AF265A|nr:GNAT family N-acetyltransferase [Streptomyces sp. H39-S7]MCZ4123589.1 GNAT family N-acetyltransferase [Streptomyces sp. H39-S7]